MSAESKVRFFQDLILSETLPMKDVGFCEDKLQNCVRIIVRKLKLGCGFHAPAVDRVIQWLYRTLLMFNLCEKCHIIIVQLLLDVNPTFVLRNLAVDVTMSVQQPKAVTCPTQCHKRFSRKQECQCQN